jgi:hypothetical protein
MYKRNSKILQRMKERGWEIGKLGVPFRAKNNSTRKAGTRRARKQEIENIVGDMRCPECGATNARDEAHLSPFPQQASTQTD